MYEKLTKEETIADIAVRANMSKVDIERALKALRESSIDSLKNGMKFDIPGICSLIPDVKKSLGVNCREEREVVIKATPLGGLVDSVRSNVNMASYEVKKENKKGIRKESMQYLK